MQIMLAHFHYGGKGSIPFSLTDEPSKFDEEIKAAELNPEQARFVGETARWVQQKRTEYPDFRDEALQADI